MKTIKARVSSKSDFTSNNSVTSLDTPNKKPRLSVIFMSALCLICIAAALFMKISLDKSLSENEKLIQKYNELQSELDELEATYLAAVEKLQNTQEMYDKLASSSSSSSSINWDEIYEKNGIDREDPYISQTEITEKWQDIINEKAEKQRQEAISTTSDKK